MRSYLRIPFGRRVRRRTPRAAACLASVFLAGALAAALVPGNTPAQPPAQEEKEVVATGAGAVFHGDQATARDRAIDDALRSAVEQVVGTMLTSETMVENFALVEDRILTKTQGYVAGYEVVEEHLNSADNTYEVRVRVRVRMGDLTSDVDAVRQLIAAKGKPRLMVIFDEETSGETSRAHPAETAAIKAFKDRGFPMVDQGAVDRLRQNESAMAAIRGDDQAAREIGVRQGAEVLVLGTGRAERAAGVESSLGGLISCRATVDARVINCNSGEIIAIESGAASGLDISERTAGHKALAKAAANLVEELTGQIIARYQEDVYSASKVRVLIHNVPDYAVLLSIKNALEGGEVRGVQGVEIRNFSGNTAELEVEAQGNAQDLAAEIAGKNIGGLGLRVVGVSADRVELRMP